ncbi:aldehyde dehydrogenase family protein [Sphingobacterium hungaricum]
MKTTPIESINEVYEKQLVHKSVLKQSLAEDRIKLLKKLLKSIENNSEQIKQALFLDFRKSPIETDITEIFAASFEIKEIIKNLAKWMRNQKVSNPLSFFSIKPYLHYEPKGNSLIITPWNYPFQLPISHFASSIAAGNTVILKLSEYSPHVNEVIASILKEIFKEEHVFVVNGAKEETTHLLSLKFDHIHFTGSSEVGKIVMAAASKNLSDITLELGGKSPVFIDKNVNVKQVVKNIIWAKFVNAGQTCIAPDYLIVDKQIQNEIEQTFKEELVRAFGENPKNSPDFARIINDKQFDRLVEGLNDARAIGAHLIAGGISDSKERYISPTIIRNVSQQNRLMVEEIFGPILPIIYVGQVNEGLNVVNRKEKPLALYIFSKDANYVEHVIRNTTAGGTCVNDAMVHILHPNLPFGGVNNSGIGQSLGWYGFKSFSHERAIAEARFMPMSKFFWFPYTDKTKSVLKWLRKVM